MSDYQVRIYLGEVDDTKGPDITEDAKAVTAERALRLVLLNLQPQPTYPEIGVYAEVRHFDSTATHLFEDYQVPPDPNEVAAHPDRHHLGTERVIPFGELRYAQAVFPSTSTDANKEARAIDRAIQCCVDAFYHMPFDTRPFAFWDPTTPDPVTGEARYLVLVDLPEDHPDRVHGFGFLVDSLELEVHQSATGRYSISHEEAKSSTHRPRTSRSE